MKYRKELSPRTRKAYEREFNAFCANLNHWFNLSPESFQKSHLADYLQRFTSENKSLARLRMHTAAIKRWYRDTFQEELHYSIDVARQAAPEIRFLSRDELQQLFSVSHRHICGLMLRLIFGAGLRLNEVTQLRVGHIQIKQRQIHIHSKDDAFSHTTIFPINLEHEIEREMAGKGPEDFIFSLRVDKHGRPVPVSRRTLQNYLRSVTRKQGLGDLSVHMLRDNFAMYLISQGVDHRHIARMMGFKNTRSIQRYVRALQGVEICVRSPL